MSVPLSIKTRKIEKILWVCTFIKGVIVMKWSNRGFLTWEIIKLIDDQPLNLDYYEVSRNLRQLTTESLDRLEKLNISRREHGKGVKLIDLIIHVTQYLSKEDRVLLWEYFDLKYDILLKESKNPSDPEDDYWEQDYLPYERRAELAEQDLEIIIEYLEFNRTNNKVASVEGFREWRDLNNKVFNLLRLNEY